MASLTTVLRSVLVTFLMEKVPMNVVAILAMFQMRTIQTSVMVSLHKDYCYNYGSITMVN